MRTESKGGRERGESARKGGLPSPLSTSCSAPSSLYSPTPAHTNCQSPCCRWIEKSHAEEQAEAALARVAELERQVARSPHVSRLALSHSHPMPPLLPATLHLSLPLWPAISAFGTLAKLSASSLSPPPPPALLHPLSAISEACDIQVAGWEEWMLSEKRRQRQQQKALLDGWRKSPLDLASLLTEKVRTAPPL